MKTKSLLSIAMLGLLVAACSNDMNDVQVPEQGKIPFVATISAKSIDSALTRSTIVENADGTLSNAWEENDQIHFGYLINKDATGEEKEDPSNWGAFIATVSKVNEDGSATITAEIDNTLADGEELYVVYPASAADGVYRWIKLDFINKQDGKLSKDRDVETAITTLKVEDGVASFAETLTLKPFLDIYKFKLIDNTGESLKVQKFSIKMSGTESIKEVTLDPATDEFYVSLPIMSGTEMTLDAKSEDGRYYTATVRATTKVHSGQAIVDYPAKYYTATVTMSIVPK